MQTGFFVSWPTAVEVGIYHHTCFWDIDDDESSDDFTHWGYMYTV